MLTLNERSGVEFDARFFATGDSPTVPTSAHWRLDCETTGTAVVDWTAVTPVVEMDDLGNIASCYVRIEIAGASNAILDAANRRETKSLLVVADKDLPREYSTLYQYSVRNLRGRA